MKKRDYLFAGLIIYLLVPGAVWAYLDPSVATYVIQVVAGAVVAVGAIVGIYWRRVKRKVADKLDIDENAGKEVEDDVVIKEEKTH